MNNVELRDFFAAHAPNPDPADICDLMGWERDLRIGDGDEIGNEQWQDTMVQRWHELPQAKRMAAITKYAYLYADSMMKAREAQC